MFSIGSPFAFLHHVVLVEPCSDVVTVRVEQWILLHVSLARAMSAGPRRASLQCSTFNLVFAAFDSISIVVCLQLKDRVLFLFVFGCIDR